MLGPLPPVEFADYLEMRFSERERDLGDALGPLLDVADGHPQRAMLLAHHLYERLGRGDSADLEHGLTHFRRRAPRRGTRSPSSGSRARPSNARF
jgi:hypothetical protein